MAGSRLSPGSPLAKPCGDPALSGARIGEDSVILSGGHHPLRPANMSGGRVERRLAAILAADVAGYSRLIGQDESGTLARLRAHRR